MSLFSQDWESELIYFFDLRELYVCLFVARHPPQPPYVLIAFIYLFWMWTCVLTQLHPFVYLFSILLWYSTGSVIYQYDPMFLSRVLRVTSHKSQKIHKLQKLDLLQTSHWGEYRADRSQLRQKMTVTHQHILKLKFWPLSKGPSIIVNIFTYDNSYHKFPTPSLPLLMIVKISKSYRWDGLSKAFISHILW